MILGFNRPRPTREQYERFKRTLVGGLSGLQQDLSLFTYGSYARGDYCPGRSDIDAMMVMPGDVVIDKGIMRDCARVYVAAQVNSHIPFQVSICDWVTLEDGRFGPYMADFQEYFSQEGKVLLGVDPRKNMNYEELRCGQRVTLAFNLRKARAALLTAAYDEAFEYDGLVRNFGKTLDATSRAASQILRLRDGVVRQQRFKGLEIAKVYPDVNAEPLGRIKWLYEKPKRLDAMYRDPSRIVQLMEESVTCFEEMVRAYIREFPRE